MSHQYKTLEDTVYFWFGANDTSGSGGDGATPVYDVRLAGAAANAAPVLSGAATLLSHGDYPAGCHEVAIAATAVNGFAAGNTYAVFCTLLVDSQNPTGFVGSFQLAPVLSDMRYILGHLLTQTGTRVADGFEHFFDVETPAITVGDAMRGTDSAATAAKLKAYVQLLARSDAAIATDRATELGEINENVASGAGDYTNQTDSGEAIRDHVGDGTNLTEAGGTGNHLSAIPWNGSWDTEVQSEVQDAIEANNLDHLCKTATAAADMTAEVADNTILSRVLANGDTSAFTPSTDGLQLIRDAIPTANTVADAVLSRGVDNVEDTADTHSLCTIVLATLESSISGTTWTIKKTGGTTFTTKTLTTDADAEPVTGVT